MTKMDMDMDMDMDKDNKKIKTLAEWWTPEREDLLDSVLHDFFMELVKENVHQVHKIDGRCSGGYYVGVEEGLGLGALHGNRDEKAAALFTATHGIKQERIDIVLEYVREYLDNILDFESSEPMWEGDN